MLCRVCQEIFSGERPQGNQKYQHLTSLLELQEGVRDKCFICAAIKRGISQYGGLDELPFSAEDIEFSSEYFLDYGERDIIELSIILFYNLPGGPAHRNRSLLIRPWNGKSSVNCNS
jgi:hypothetical protein